VGGVLPVVQKVSQQVGQLGDGVLVEEFEVVGWVR
jgi:hypothetical protein